MDAEIFHALLIVEFIKIGFKATSVEQNTNMIVLRNKQGNAIFIILDSVWKDKVEVKAYRKPSKQPEFDKIFRTHSPDYTYEKINIIVNQIVNELKLKSKIYYYSIT